MSQISFDILKDFDQTIDQLKKFRTKYCEKLIHLFQNNSITESFLSSPLNEMHKKICTSPLKVLQANKTKPESLEKFSFKGFQDESSALRFLIDSQFLFAFESRAPISIDTCPPWLSETYCQWLAEPPAFFTGQDDVIRYAEHLEKLLHTICKGLLAQSVNSHWGVAATQILPRLSTVPLYFTELNVRSIMKMRATILELLLEAGGAQLDRPSALKPGPKKPIKIGFINSHFAPSTETFGAIPRFEHISSDEWEVHLYCYQSSGTEIEEYCKSKARSFTLLPANAMEAAEVIRERELDCAIFGTNVTAIVNDMTTLIAHRVAPIQIPHAGSPMTTGFRNCDYFIGWTLTETAANRDELFTEKLILQEGPSASYTKFADTGERTTDIERASLDIPEDAVCLISGANVSKLIPKLCRSWVRILAETKNTYLLLYPFGPAWNTTYPVEIFLKQFSIYLQEADVSPDRVKILKSTATRADIFSYLELADIYLDSFPFAGGTSLYDPLFNSLPVVAMDGHTFRLSMAASVLKDMDLNECVSQSIEEYIEKAKDLVKDATRREKLSQKTKEAMSNNPPFLDTKKYSKLFEACLNEIIAHHPRRAN